MKKHTIKKLIATVLVLVLAITVLTGCSLFTFDEEADYAQVIVKINSVNLEYEVPIYEDYLDTDDKPVYELDEDRTSANFGKTTDTVVKAVKRDHNNNPIHVAKTQDGKVLYLGYSKLDNTSTSVIGDVGTKVEVFEDDVKAVKEKNVDEYWVNPVDGEEFKYLGVGDEHVAKWQSVDSNKYYFGNTDYDGTTNGLSALSTALRSQYNEVLPTVHYLSTEREGQNAYFYTLTPIAKTETFDSPEFEVFKESVISYFDSYFNQYMEENNYTTAECFEDLIELTYNRYVYYVEALLSVKSGDAEYGVTERNTINKYVYTQIESQFNTIFQEIADDFDQEYSTIEDAEDGDSTYPTKDTTVEKDAEDEKDYEVWHISQEPARCLGNSTVALRNSFEREAMRRFVDYLEDQLENTYAMSETDRTKFEAEIAEMRNSFTSDEETEKLYTQLYTYGIIYHYFGETREQALVISQFQQYLYRNKGLLSLSDSDVQQSYDELLAEQKESFDSNIQNYYTACSNDETIVYFADDEYFWVKHILLPFSATDTANLTEFKTNHTDAEIQKYRKSLADNMVAYKHIDGEDDTDNPMTVKQVYDNVFARMSAAEASAYDAERTFNDLIFDYNTDTGIFNNEKGYAVTKTPASLSNGTEKYMQEFADEARALLGAYENGQSLYDYKESTADNSPIKYTPTSYDITNKNRVVKIGSISGPIVTDYGVHIMYLANVPQAGSVAHINSYLTPGKYTTVYDAVASDTLSTQQNNAYTTWQYSAIKKYKGIEGAIEIFKGRFEANLWDYADDYDEYLVNKAAEEEESADSTNA